MFPVIVPSIQLEDVGPNIELLLDRSGGESHDSDHHSTERLDVHTSHKENHDFAHQTTQERIHSLTHEFRQALSETLQEEQGISVWDFYRNLSHSDEGIENIINIEEKHRNTHSSGRFLQTGLGEDRFRLRSNSDASALSKLALKRFNRKRSIDVQRFPVHSRVIHKEDGKQPILEEKSPPSTPQESWRKIDSEEKTVNETAPSKQQTQKQDSNSVSPESSEASDQSQSPRVKKRTKHRRKSKAGISNMKEASRSHDNLQSGSHSQDGINANSNLLSPRGGSHEALHLSTSPRTTNYVHPNRKLHGRVENLAHDSPRDTPSPGGVQAHILRRLSHITEDNQMRQRSASDVTNMMKLKKLSKIEESKDPVPRRRVSISHVPPSVSPRQPMPHHMPPMSHRKHGDVSPPHHLPHLHHHHCKGHKGCDVCNELEPNNLPKDIHLRDFPAFHATHLPFPEPTGSILKASSPLSPIYRRRATVGHVMFAHGSKAPDLSVPTLSTSPKNHGVFHYVYDEKTKHSTQQKVDALIFNVPKLSSRSNSGSLDSDSPTNEDSLQHHVESTSECRD